MACICAFQKALSGVFPPNKSKGKLYDRMNRSASRLTGENVRGLSSHYPLYDFDLRATHARTLLPAALASVSFGFVLVRVRTSRRGLSAQCVSRPRYTRHFSGLFFALVGHRLNVLVRRRTPAALSIACPLSCCIWPIMDHVAVWCGLTPSTIGDCFSSPVHQYFTRSCSLLVLMLREGYWNQQRRGEELRN